MKTSGDIQKSVSTKLPDGYQYEHEYDPYEHRKVAHPLTYVSFVVFIK